MRKDITPFYRALGLQPGAEAIEIRRAYRQMVQQWHPDLYKAGSPMQTTAEDITKEINEAYDQLYRKKLYRNFAPKTESGSKNAPKSDGESVKPAPKERARPPKRRQAREAKAANPSRVLFVQRWLPLARALAHNRWLKRGLILCLFSAVVWIGRGFMGDLSWPTASRAIAAPDPAKVIEATETTPRVAPRGARADIAPRATHLPSMETMHLGFAPLRESASTANISQSSYTLADQTLQGPAALIDRAASLLDVIEVGDTKEKVLSKQGKPDEESDTIFRYGSSVVYFGNGLVRGWINRFPRLHVREWVVAAAPTLDGFTTGSSRSDVVRAQGMPSEFTDSHYSYGSSVIFFDGNQVRAWNEGDVLLRQFELPTLPFVNLDRRGTEIGSRSEF